MTTLNIPLAKGTKERLTRIAIRYGLSLRDFSRHVLEEVTEDIPEEKLSDYAQPKRLEASLRRALRDWRAGRVRRKL